MRLLTIALAVALIALFPIKTQAYDGIMLYTVRERGI
jgi:hypothetical protein